MPDTRERLATALAPRYTIERELGSGGMGVVYEGRDTTLGRSVAVKILPPERATAVAVERFLREARLLARLLHPHIIPVLEAQQSSDLLWFVMPRVDGDSLAERLRRGPMRWNEVRRIGLDLASALEHAHAHGVIHRDIKPANVFLQSGRVLLADFGVALLDASGESTLTEADQLVGTLRYMAPEQRAGLDATERSDIYALGATLFEASSGRRWDASIGTDSRAWHDVPRYLRRALRGALQADPARRWKSAVAFRRAIAASGRGIGRIAPGLIVGALTVAAVLALRTIITGRANAALAARRPRSAIAVVPFRGGADDIGFQLAKYTAIQLELAPIPAGAIAWARASRLDVDAAMRISNTVVTGRVMSHDGQADTVEVELSDSMHGEVLRVPRPAGDVAMWGRAIADSIMNRKFPQQVTDFRQIGMFPNRQAIDAWFAGQLLFQRGDWGQAQAKFTESWNRDTLFFPAAWGRLLALEWQRQPFETELARLASRFPVPLNELARTHLELDIERRLARYDSLARLFPDYPTVREMYANELFSRGPLVGRSLREGVDSFRSLAEHFPVLDEATTYTQTVWGLVRLGDRDLAVEQLARRKTKAYPGDNWSDMLWLAVHGRFQRWLAAPARAIMLMIAKPPMLATLHQAVRLGLEVDDPQDQLAIGNALQRSKSATDSMRASAYAAQSTALLLLGRPLAALAKLDSAAARVPHDRGFRLEAAEWRVLLPLLPGAGIDLSSDQRDAGRNTLRAIAADDAFWPRAAWTLLVDAGARGAVHERDSLVAMLHSLSGGEVSTELAALADAIRLGSAGNPDSALELSRSIRRVTDADHDLFRGPLVRAFMYLSRGAWELQRGNTAAAAAELLWYENNDIQGWPSREPQQGEMDAALSGVGRLLRAELLLRLGETQRACKLLARVSTLWSGAESSLAALRARVNAGAQQCHR